MALTHDIGEISFYSNRAHWKIPFFLDIPHRIDSFICSPRFQFEGRNWIITICLNGTTEFANCEGWFGMEVSHEYLECSSKLDVRFGIIGRNEEDIVNYRAHKTSTYRRTKIIRYSAIESNKAYILPGGFLHLFMSVEEIDDSVVNPVTQVKAKNGK